MKDQYPQGNTLNEQQEESQQTFVGTSWRRLQHVFSVTI